MCIVLLTSNASYVYLSIDLYRFHVQIYLVKLDTIISYPMHTNAVLISMDHLDIWITSDSLENSEAYEGSISDYSWGCHMSWYNNINTINF